jgi:hypothetical protein
MKKALAILGGLFLVVLVGLVGLVGYGAYQGRGLDASSKAYVEANVPPIISTWSKEELLKRSSPRLLSIINEKPEMLDQLFAKLSKLGAMQSFGDVKGDTNISITQQNGKVVTATYVGAAKFANGDAQINVRLIQSPSGEWQFLLLNVNSPIMLQ